MHVVAVLAAFGLYALAAADRPARNDTAGTARWLVQQAQWGVLSTSSVHLQGAAFGNPISLTDALGDGTPYFYVSMLDASLQDLERDSRCTLTLSEAAMDCATLGLDPEDPPCIRLSLSGRMVNVTDAAEAAKAKAALFKRHPSMKYWPADHNWLITKLSISKIWLIDYFGGATDLPVTSYAAASTAKPDVLVPINATHRKPQGSKPFVFEKVRTARWLAHQTTWGVIATTSIHLNGSAFGNVISHSDGTRGNGTGVPYFYVSSLDTSIQDLQKDPRCTLTLSQASVDCGERGLDPEDPRCVRLSLSGNFTKVEEDAEVAVAKAALFDVHPEMKYWPESHDFYFAKLTLSAIWLIDFFGGAKNISPKDYLAEKPARLAAQAAAVTTVYV